MLPSGDKCVLVGRKFCGLSTFSVGSYVPWTRLHTFPFNAWQENKKKGKRHRERERKIERKREREYLYRCGRHRLKCAPHASRGREG